jgi:dolichyl-phosphate beta-glucosyltransferase
MNISLILPAYNERRTILDTVDQAFAYFAHRGMVAEIIVAADGDDGTREAVGERAKTTPNLKVLGHKERLGKGRGVREAVAMAQGDIIGYADADNKVPIEEFDKIRPVLAAGVDLAAGSRALAESQIDRRQPLYRRIGSKGFEVFMHAVVGLPEIRDTQCGFKFFQRKAALEVFRRQEIDGYMFDVEILALALKLGYRVKEIPIRWRDDGDSRLQLVRGNLKNVQDIFRIRRSLRRAREPAQRLAASGTITRR